MYAYNNEIDINTCYSCLCILNISVWLHILLNDSILNIILNKMLFLIITSAFSKNLKYIFEKLNVLCS